MINLLWLLIMEGVSLFVHFSLTCQLNDKMRVNHCCILASS